MASLFPTREPRSGVHSFALVILGILLAFGSAAAEPEAKTRKKNLPGADIFDATGIIRVNIDIPASGMSTLARAGGWGGRGGSENRPEVKVTISDGSKTYTNVALHLKGAAGSFRPIDDKPGLTLNFDKFAPGQSFHGLHKLSLNNSVQDKTMITEKLCREIFRAAGVPVPRADYAVVTLNGRSLGMYVLLEGYNKQFLKQFFPNVGGNLYDGGFCQDISERMQVNSGDKPNDRSDLKTLWNAAARARQNDQLAELSKILDVDRFITMVALEVMTCHWDGYALNRNNYRVFHDMDSGKMVFMPHGMDQMFGTGSSGDRMNVRSSLVPRMNGAVAAAVLGTTEGRERYLKRVRELSTNIFNADQLVSRVQEIEARLQPVYAKVQSAQQVNNHLSRVATLVQNIEDRGRAIDEYLGTPTKNPVDSERLAKLESWQPKITEGAAKVDIFTYPTGIQVLHIKADQGATAASWRTKLPLERGRYRFESQAYTTGMSENGGGGAILRVSGATVSPQISANTRWVTISYPFEVEQDSAEIELVCEFKGSQGHVWFDPQSMKLRRLK